MTKILELLAKANQYKLVIFNTLVVVGGTLTYLMSNEVVTQYPAAVAWMAQIVAGINVVAKMLGGKPVDTAAKK